MLKVFGCFWLALGLVMRPVLGGAGDTDRDTMDSKYFVRYSLSERQQKRNGSLTFLASPFMFFFVKPTLNFK